LIKTAKITNGPAAWLEKSGPVIFMDLDWVIVAIEGTDDYGSTTYNVRLPLACVKIVSESAVA
jgi:hypothetical protein